MASLIQGPKLAAELARLQSRLGSTTAEGVAGAGMVKVVCNVKEMISCSVSDEAMKLNDRELLEDLIKAATNQALQKAGQNAREEMAKMMQDLGLPAGMGLPDGLELPSS
jgi:DNA-binding protein YbaB